MQVNLLKAIRAIDKLESHKDRQDFFDYYVNKFVIAKIIIKFHSLFKGTILSGLMYYAFAARYFLKKPYTTTKRFSLIASIDYINEKRAIADFLELVKDHLNVPRCTNNIRLFIDLTSQFFRKPKDLYRILKFLVRFEKNRNFLNCCRIAEFIFINSVAKHVIKSNNAKGVVIASNYTPVALGLKVAAESLNIPTIYTFHSTVPMGIEIPPLSMDFACLYGENALESFKQHGPVNCKVITYSGLSGESCKMKIKESLSNVKSAGVFLTAYIDDKYFRKLLKSLSENYNIEEIIVRPHPLKIANPDLSILSEFPKARIDAGGRVINSAHKCDFVVAGSSTVHVEVLKSGVPSLYWEDFDTAGPDYYGFLKDGIVLEIKDVEKIDWEAIKNYYNDDWVKRFQKLDFSYMRDPQEIRENIELALVQLLNKSN